jgi:hypothetical protein
MLLILVTDQLGNIPLFITALERVTPGLRTRGPGRAAIIGDRAADGPRIDRGIDRHDHERRAGFFSAAV